MSFHGLRPIRVLMAGFTAAVFAVSSLCVASAADEPTITVANGAVTPPFATQDNDGDLTGFEPDLMRAIGKAAGFKVKFKVLPFAGVVPALQAGSVDAAIDLMTITKGRLKSIDFSNAYYRAGLSIVVKKGSPIKDAQDLTGHVVAVEKSSSAVQYLEQHPQIKPRFVKEFATADQLYAAVMTGGVDAIIYDNPINVAFELKNKDARIVGGLLTGEYYGIGITKKDPGLAKQINDGLEKVMQNGEYAALFTKYFGGDTSGEVHGVKTAAEVAVSN